GDNGQLGDGRSFRVVEAAQLPDGRCEFLAVAPRSPESSASAGHDEEAGSAALAPLEAQALPLPYSLPD
ncbi:MAG: hypothetical protein WBE92_05300, partial [Steroidobacteraceae bacterium]